ncbi:MAG: flagellar hook assembly protein FlgD [Spirochaetia bacterium]
MDFTSVLSGSERSKVEMQVEETNKSLKQGEGLSQELGKDDFLQLLITQLQHQDPTKPMDDKQFIAQMAQFSSLEQMTNLGQEFSKISGIVNRGNALNLLDKQVEILDGKQRVYGRVEAVSGTENPQVKVNGRYYDYSVVETVNTKEAAE